MNLTEDQHHCEQTPCTDIQQNRAVMWKRGEKVIEPPPNNVWFLLRLSRWRSWLRHCATSRKVAGSIPSVVAGIFYSHNPSGRTKALGSTQPLTEMSTRNIFWVIKAAGA